MPVRNSEQIAMTDPCPNCGWVETNEVSRQIEPEVAAGFVSGRNGMLCVVPQEYESVSSRAGSWKHGWRQGHAVWVQMRKGQEA